MLDNPSLTSQKINTQIEKLNDAKNKLIETLKAKLNGKDICFMNNVNNHNFVTNNQLNNHYRMSFIANSTYYFDIFFEDKNLSYDVYYSETNPTDLDLSNLTYLKKKSLTYLELVYSREVLPQSGYLWIKEQTIDNPNSNVYLFDDTIKSANNEPGKYFYTCTLINKNNQTKDLGTLSYYLNIFENDASDFKLEKYFNQNLAK